MSLMTSQLVEIKTIMGKTHNKKRNVGVIYELLVRYIASAIVEKNESKRKIASKILKKHYSIDSEIYKEFRLFAALANSTVSSLSVASSILQEAKRASKHFNSAVLEKEKSKLIRDINYQLNDKNFYSAKISEYKVYATIQTLLNEWRCKTPSNLSLLAEYEDKIMNHLIESKDIKSEPVDKKDIDNLVVRIMAEKYNNRYGSSLVAEQKKILRTYVFSKGNSHDLKGQLNEIKSCTMKKIDEFARESDNEYVLSKISGVKEKISDHNFDTINDASIEKALTLVQLKHELETIDD